MTVVSCDCCKKVSHPCERLELPSFYEYNGRRVSMDVCQKCCAAIGDAVMETVKKLKS